MSKSYQSIRLGGDGRNAESLGDFVTWLVANNLLDSALEQRSGSQLARVKMQDISGGAFLTTVLDGELKPEHLNSDGQKFCEHYLVSGDYDREIDKLELDQENDWLRYDMVAPKISAAYRALNEPNKSIVRSIAKVIQFPKRK
jgi:hypothetical protein